MKKNGKKQKKKLFDHMEIFSMIELIYIVSSAHQMFCHKANICSNKFIVDAPLAERMWFPILWACDPINGALWTSTEVKWSRGGEKKSFSCENMSLNVFPGFLWGSSCVTSKVGKHSRHWHTALLWGLHLGLISGSCGSGSWMGHQFLTVSWFSPQLLLFTCSWAEPLIAPSGRARGHCRKAGRVWPSLLKCFSFSGKPTARLKRGA